jgi:hypothetical protein
MSLLGFEKDMMVDYKMSVLYIHTCLALEAVWTLDAEMQWTAG